MLIAVLHAGGRGKSLLDVKYQFIAGITITLPA